MAERGQLHVLQGNAEPKADACDDCRHSRKQFSTLPYLFCSAVDRYAAARAGVESAGKGIG